LTFASLGSAAVIPVGTGSASAFGVIAGGPR
jgi:hypothetical protein